MPSSRAHALPTLTVMRSLLLAFACLAAALLAGPAVAAAATGPCVPGGPMCHFWTGKVTFIADGDTIDVDVDGDGTHRFKPVRLTGINAMELHRYSKYPARRRGDCHGLEATARLEQLLRAAHLRVRLAAQDVSAHSGHRLRRQVSVRLGGRWVDLNRVLVAEGHALWMPHSVEWAWNADYRALSQAAAAAHLRLWNPRGCGVGPSPDAGLSMRLDYDADGNDGANVNGELARIANPSGAPVSLAGWWFRDSALRRYTFPPGAVIPAGGSIVLHMGRGPSGGDEFHWGLSTPPFDNPSYDQRSMGDGAYLFDPRGNLRDSVIYP
jgi:endonuclease YncB( thermonuclease family)